MGVFLLMMRIQKALKPGFKIQISQFESWCYILEALSYHLFHAE